MFRMIAMGEEGRTVVECADHREVIGPRREADVRPAQIAAHTIETCDQTAKCIGDPAVVVVFVAPLESHYVSESHGFHCRDHGYLWVGSTGATIER